MSEEGERLARLEQWQSDHTRYANKNFDQIERRFDINDSTHEQILDRIDHLERSLLVYRRIIYLSAAGIGMAAGFVIRYWDFIVHRMGH